MVPMKGCRDLVAALTCPDFELKTLGEDVPWSVLRAAVGSGSTDICSVDKNPFKGSDGYTWAVAPNQTALTYVAKKDGTPTDNDYDFKIIFPADNDWKSEPRVWVKDVPQDNACDEVKSALQDASRYQNYDLKIYIGSTANVCVGDYGSAKSGELLRAVKSNAPYAAYATGCVAGAAICNTAMAIGSGGLTIPQAIISGAEDMVMCGAVAAGLKFITPMVTGIAIGEDAGTAKQLFLPLVGAGIGTAGTYYYYSQHSLYRFVKDNRTLVTALENAAKTAGGSDESAAEAAAKQAIKAILGTKSQREESILAELANAKKSSTASKYTSRLKKMAKIAEDAGDDVLAKQLDDLAEAIAKGDDKAIEKAFSTVIKSLSKEGTLSRLVERLKALQQGAQRGRTQAFVCGALSQAMGATLASITAMAQVVSTDMLTVTITPDTVMSISTSLGTIAAGHTTYGSTSGPNIEMHAG